MNLPNKLSILRICLIPLFVVAYFLPYYWGSFVAVAIFVIAAFTDFLDGYIARKYNLVTDLGKLLDPIADKILICAALFCVVATNPLQYTYASMIDISLDFSFYFGQIFLAVGGAIIIARELLVSAVRQIAASKGVVVQANIYGKVKTVLQDVALPMLILLKAQEYLVVESVFFDILWILSIVLFGIAIIMTLISGTIYLVQNKKVFTD